MPNAAIGCRCGTVKTNNTGCWGPDSQRLLHSLRAVDTIRRSGAGDGERAMTPQHTTTETVPIACRDVAHP
jgi:hypothetical protein